MEAALVKELVGYGVFGLLFFWLLLNSWKRQVQREDKLMEFLAKVGPALERVNREVSAVTAITSRIESKVDGCDDRREKHETHAAPGGVERRKARTA